MLPVATELVRRIGWLIKLRWLAAAGVLAAVEVAHWLLGLRLPLAPLYGVVAGLALYNAVLLVVSRRLPQPHASVEIDQASPLARFLVPRTFWGLGLEPQVLQAAVFAMAQISLDLVFLALLLHLSGGIDSPLAFFSIFHVIFASILLSRRATYLQASLALLMVCAVAAAEGLGWLEHHPLDLWAAGGHTDPLRVGVRLVVLGATLFISAYVCSTIAVHLRVQERSIVLLSRELTGRAEDLARAYERVSEVEQTKSQYLRKVAHELRGPLGTIQTTLRVVLGGLSREDPARAEDLIRRAERRAAELGEVTADLLTLSRAREGQLEAPRVEVRLDQIVREAADEAGAAAEQAGVTLELAVREAPELTLQGDPAQLRQLVRNLLSNAVRYTPAGGRVQVGLRRREGALRLEVEDSGIGVAQEDQARIFDEFFRARAGRDHAPSGTGLGLAIVKAIAEQHGGTVSVESEVGRGSAFVVELPTAGA